MEPGTKIGTYEVTDSLGKGGMGEVYLAHDSNLGREVAIKVLPTNFASDSERLARFQLEAQTLASLNHTNVATVFGFEHDDALDIHYLIMEYIDGQTLTERIESRSLSLNATLDIFIQIAQGLDAAHEAGIVHRDLKPDNIKIASDGTLKLIDFGIAKSTGESRSLSPDAPTTPMSPVAVTAEGTFMGTPVYMSPEQARGQTVGKGTDIWSYGCCLYEALTRNLPFKGDTIADTVGNILKTDPDWSDVPSDTPREVRSLLRRCLEKDARKRFSSAGDMAYVLEEYRDRSNNLDNVHVSPASVAVMSSATSRYSAMGLIAVMAVVIGALLMRSPSGSGIDSSSDTESSRQIGSLAVLPFDLPPLAADHPLYENEQAHLLEKAAKEALAAQPKPVRRFEISIADNLILDPYNLAFSFSADGSSMAYSGVDETGRKIFLRNLEGDSDIVVPGSENGLGPALSPDGEWVAFFANDGLHKISLRTGASLEIVKSVGEGRGIAWGKDGSIAYATSADSQGLRYIPAGDALPLTLMSFYSPRLVGGARWPQFLPGDKSILFTARTGGGLWDLAGNLYVIQLETGEVKEILGGGLHGRYLETGHIVYAKDGALLAVPFDLDELQVSGPSVPVLSDVRMRTDSGLVYYAVSSDGLLSYVPGGVEASRMNMAWVDHTGNTELIPASVSRYRNLRVSPDGSRIAAQSGGDIFIYELDRNVFSRFTFEGINNHSITWTPDGSELIFVSIQAEKNTTETQSKLMRKSADGSSEAVVISLEKSLISMAPTSVTSDGKTLVMYITDGTNGFDIWTVSLEGDGAVRTILDSPANEGRMMLSPDNEWLAYSSDESGRYEVYLQGFPDGKGKWQISNAGGVYPLWAPDQSKLYYRSEEGVMAVDLVLSDSVQIGKPYLLFPDRFSNTSGYQWDIAPDGKRFLMIAPSEQEGEFRRTSRVKVVTNWFEELKRLAPNPNNN